MEYIVCLSLEILLCVVLAIAIVVRNIVERRKK